MGFGEQRDRYQPETRLEAGLGGERWIATDRVRKGSVVLAVLDARAATDAHRATFEAFRAAGAKLGHPSLEKLVDSGETALGNPYFAVERADGETLAQRLEREPAMSVHELVRVATAVVDGLVIAHRAGLVHGDVAPDRILLLGGGRAKLLGFGLNRAVARSLASTREASTLPSSDAFMSPEQAGGNAASFVDDLWSVAAVLYRGVTGQPPRANADGRSTVANIVARPTRPAVALRPDLPLSFGQLLDRALASDPGLRFKDAAELRKALTSALILAPTVARLPVVAFPRAAAREGAGGIDTHAPALPPPPTRSRTGIGPIGARESGEFSGVLAVPKEPSDLPPAAVMESSPKVPAMRRGSAPPPLPSFLGGAERTSTAPATDELEELSDFDEAEASAEFSPEEVLATEAAVAEAHAAGARTPETAAATEVTAPAAAPHPVAPPTASPRVSSIPRRAPSTSTPGAEAAARTKRVVIESRRGEPIVPAKGWVAIAVFALGVFVAAAGGFRLFDAHNAEPPTTPRSERQAAPRIRSAPTIQSGPPSRLPTPPSASMPAQVATPTPARVEASAPSQAVDAGAPPTPAVVVPPPPPPIAPRPAAPPRTPRTASTATMTPTMTTAMTTMHTLARDPGF